MAKDDDIISDALEEFQRSAEAEDENRELALDDLKFAMMSEQWPEDIRRKRETDGRPCLTINKMPALVRQIVNDARQNKPAIKVRPADSGADPDTASVMSDLIRNIEVTSDSEVAYDTALEAAVVGGFGYFRINAEHAHDDTFDIDLAIRRIADPFTVYGDENSTAADSSDWNKAFITEVMLRDDFKRKYKGAEEVDWSGYEDLKQPWSSEDSIMIAEYWKREPFKREIVRLSNGVIMDGEMVKEMLPMLSLSGLSVVGNRVVDSMKVVQYLMTGAEVLEKNDWPGRYIPIIPVYGDEVNIEGKRHFKGLIRDAKDAQRMFNYWRTTSTELVALAPRVPFIGPRGAFSTDAAKWATINTNNYAYVEFDGGIPPQRQPLDSGGAIGAMQEAMAAADDIKTITGMYDASLGARSNETSGRAIMARQREGDVSNFHYIDNLSRAIRHAGRVLIDLIPHYYTGERVLRVIGQDGEPRNVKLGSQQEQPETPEGVEGADRIYDLSAGKYDLVVDSGPSFTTRREESAQQMTELIRAFPAAAPVIGDLLAKNLDWPGAEEIAERMKSLLPASARGEDPAAQQMQAALQQMQQKIAELTGDKSMEVRKLDIDAYNAETNRLKVAGAGMQPEQVQALVLQTLQQVLMSPDVLPPQSPPPQQQFQPQPAQPAGTFPPEMGQSPTEME